MTDNLLILKSRRKVTNILDNNKRILNFNNILHN